MEHTIPNSSLATRSTRQDRNGLFACGMWMRAGLIGMGAFTVGVSGLLEGGMSGASALALMLAGGALAVVGTRLAYAVLDRPGDPAQAPAAGNSPAREAAPKTAAQRYAGARPA